MDFKARLNLRGTHYQLGDSSEIETETSNRRDYIKKNYLNNFQKYK